MEDKVRSVRDRIYEATGVRIEPIYYSAGYKEEGGEQGRPYNLSKLLYYIVKATPSEKRVVYANNINEDAEMWKDDDELLDYGEETRKSIFESITEGASKGADMVVLLAVYLAALERLLAVALELLLVVLLVLSVACLDKEVHYE